MTDNLIAFKPIGILHSEHIEEDRTPIQSKYAQGCEGKLVVFPEFSDGLRDIDSFSHLYLVVYFHKHESRKLRVSSYLQPDIERGIFATRAPCRPNPIGISIVELIRREDNILFLDCVDIMDGAPVLDIKPYTRRFDHIETKRNGWQDEVDDETARIRAMRNYRGVKKE